MLELLKHKLKPRAKILDVGSGTGILLAYIAAACEASVAAAGGGNGDDDNVGGGGGGGGAPSFRIFGVEHVDELTRWSMANLAKDERGKAWLEDGRISVTTGDGRLGLPAAAPFDCIHVGAAAPSTPHALIAQLAPGGRLIVPVGDENDQQLMQYDASEMPGGEFTETALFGVQYVPLTDLTKQHGPSTFLA